jgi:hypothetical protein
MVDWEELHMVITKSWHGSVVKITTIQEGTGWTLEVEVDNHVVHQQDTELFLTEQEALSAGDALAEPALRPLH